MSRRRTWRLSVIGAALWLSVGACGIGKLEKEDRGPAADPKRKALKAASDARSGKTTASSKSGGSSPKASLPITRTFPPPEEAGGQSSARSTFQVAIGKVVQKVTGKRIFTTTPTTPASPPETMRGVYFVTDSGRRFVPCHSGREVIATVWGGEQVRLDETLRFMSPDLRAPLYLVVTASWAPLPVDPNAVPQRGGRQKGGRRKGGRQNAQVDSTAAPADTLPKFSASEIWIRKVDSLEAKIPSSCIRD